MADTTSAGAAVGIAAFFIIFFALDIGLIVLWILSIIDIARRPDWQWRIAGKEKVMWLVLVVLINFLSIYYWWWLRRDLQRVEREAAAGHYGPGSMTFTGWQPGPPMPWAAAPGPPHGWYPDPAGSGGNRYWDGRGWTSHTRS